MLWIMRQIGVMGLAGFVMTEQRRIQDDIPYKGKVKGNKFGNHDA